MQKIIPCLWFDDQAEDAAKFYTDVFSGKILRTTPYHVETPSKKPVGSTLTVEFEIHNFKIVALNGGPFFEINPSISLFITCESKEELNRYYNKLKEDCFEMMPLGTYEFSDHYVWLKDKFGMSWQLMLVKKPIKAKVTPSLLFTQEYNGKAMQAIEFYTSVFKDTQIQEVILYEEDSEMSKKGTVKYAGFKLAGQRFAAMDGGNPHQFKFNEAVSLIINCQTQEELDYYTNKLSANPEAEVCGWVKDKFGVSWQVNPIILDEILNGKDKEKAKRAMQAMLEMKRLNISQLEQA